MLHQHPAEAAPLVLPRPHEPVKPCYVRVVLERPEPAGGDYFIVNLKHVELLEFVNMLVKAYPHVLQRLLCVVGSHDIMYHGDNIAYVVPAQLAYVHEYKLQQNLNKLFFLKHQVFKLSVQVFERKRLFANGMDSPSLDLRFNGLTVPEILLLIILTGELWIS